MPRKIALIAIGGNALLQQNQRGLQESSWKTRGRRRRCSAT